MARSTVLLSFFWAGCAASDAGGLEEAQMVGARILDPGCAGSPYATIQAAINAAVNGDEISICAGTYTGRLTIAGKTLTLRPQSGLLDVTLDAQTFGTGLTITTGSNVTIEKLRFINGNAANLGGDVACQTSVLNVTDSEFLSGSAGRGGGNGSTGCTGAVTGNLFDTNGAWRGGAVWASGDDLVIQGNTFTNNDSVDSGGALYVEGSSDILDNTFDGNHSGVYGGGAYVGTSFGTISGNTLTNNTSVNDGGGMYVQFGTPTVSNNVFTGNDSSDEAGALRVKESFASILDNEFTSNHADYRGGAMKVSHEGVIMTGNTFTDNSTWVDGGAVLLYEAASTLTDNTFEGNEAFQSGGALYITAGWDPVVVEDCTFIENEASVNGGHIYINLVGVLTTLRRVELNAGSAVLGGAVYATNSPVVIENSLLRFNDASTSGGGLYLDATTGRITNVVSWRNTSPAGAGLTVANGGVLDVANNVFARNTGGSAFLLSSGTAPTIRYNDFNQNTSNFSGVPNQLNLNGNKGWAPRFTNANAGIFTLQTTSQMIDRGDPLILDLNGTRSDMGVYGGPESF